MNFQPGLAQQVMAGRKTVTRRVCSPNPRSPWFAGGCRLKEGKTYAVCPGRGVDAIGRVRVVSVRREPVNGIMVGDELAKEGFASVEAFTEVWCAMHGSYDPGTLVWRVEFAVAEIHAAEVPPRG